MSAQNAAGLSGCAPCRLQRHGHSASIPHVFAPAALRAPLEEDVRILTEADTYFARAEYCYRLKCVRPVLNDRGIIDIVKGRHPLLEKDKAVPVSVSIGEKYRLRDSSFGRIDLNTYFIRLQEQDDTVASWSDGTITKLKQVLAKILVETEYLDDVRADHLNPVYLYPILENAIRSHGDLAILPAFNCFS